MPYLTDKPTSIAVMGTKWGNENRGGITFKLDNMPAGVDMFIVYPMDVGLELFFTQVMTAITSSRTIKVDYRATGTICEVVAIYFPDDN